MGIKHRYFENIKQLEENTPIANDTDGMLKRSISPFAKLCDRRSEIHNILTQDISATEIRKSILRQKDNKATGNDNTPTEISEQNIEEWITPSKH